MECSQNYYLVEFPVSVLLLKNVRMHTCVCVLFFCSSVTSSVKWLPAKTNGEWRSTNTDKILTDELLYVCKCHLNGLLWRHCSSCCSCCCCSCCCCFNLCSMIAFSVSCHFVLSYHTEKINSAHILYEQPKTIEQTMAMIKWSVCIRTALYAHTTHIPGVA